jgi:hypothetical protein
MFLNWRHLLFQSLFNALNVIQFQIYCEARETKMCVIVLLGYTHTKNSFLILSKTLPIYLFEEDPVAVKLITLQKSQYTETETASVCLFRELFTTWSLFETFCCVTQRNKPTSFSS